MNTKGFHASWVVVLLAASWARGGELPPSGRVEFLGTIDGPKDISAIGAVGDLLVIGSDEVPDKVQLLRRLDPDRYQISGKVKLRDGNKEIDIEGIACDGKTVYVIGSHSYKRHNLKDGRTHEENREQLTETELEKSRDALYRFKFDSGGNASDPEKINLRPIIEDDKFLGAFSKIPSKENGVDIEGIAADGQWLYVGFRGPMLDNTFVPVLRVKFDSPQADHELRFVALGGRGIRDLARVEDGFLVLAGPVGDGPGSFQLYHWDGEDVVPGTDRPAGKVTLLGDLAPEPHDGKAEALLVVSENGPVYNLIVVYDGVTNGGAARFHVTKP